MYIVIHVCMKCLHLLPHNVPWHNGHKSSLILWFLTFPVTRSIDKVSKVTSPVLVIHGTEDEVIDFSHGLAIYERCPRTVEPLWVEGAGHNDVELYGQYLERLKQFITQELPAMAWMLPTLSTFSIDKSDPTLLWTLMGCGWMWTGWSLCRNLILKPCSDLKADVKCRATLWHQKCKIAQKSVSQI